MRPIDADELLDEICREQCERKFTDCDGMCEMAAVVVNAPTVDAVPVVRCKDCIYRNDTEKGKALMWLPCEEVRKGDNWFCAEGERRDDDA